MKIIIVINNILNSDSDEFSIGGIQTYIRELCHNINKCSSDEVNIIQLSKKYFETTVDGINVIGSGVSSIKALNTYIHEHYNKENVLLIFATDKHSFATNKFITINIQHGIAYDVEAYEGVRKIFSLPIFSNFYKLLQRRNARKLASNGDYLCCVDYNYYNWIKTYGSWHGQRISVIPNFSRIIETRNDKNKDVLIARRFVERRGIGLISDAIGNYLNEGGILKFTFAGEGPDIGIIKDLQVRHPDHIEITKFHPSEAQEFHSKFKYAIVPSLGSEGTTLSLLEAMASKCVTLSCHVGGITNIVIDGFNGFLIKPDRDSLLNGIKRLEKLPTSEVERISNAGFETIEYGFSIDKWRADWLELIELAKNDLISHR